MAGTTLGYPQLLVTRFGEGWNRFWYAPSDPCVLGFLRVLTGLAACYWVGTYTFDLDRFFGPEGIMDLATIRELTTNPDRWVRFSYLDYVQSSGVLWAVHVAGLVVLALFTAGFQSRITSILSLLVVISYMHRSPLITSQVEPVLCFLMFYIALGPSGKSLSLDAWLASRRQPAAPVGPPSSWGATLVVRLIQIHVTVVYVMMGLGKLFSDIWWNGTAVWSLLALPETPMVNLTWLYNSIFLINAWTHAIVLFELSFGVLVRNRLACPLMLGIALVMWTSLALITGLGAFCAAMMIASLSFTPPGAIRRFLTCCP